MTVFDSDDFHDGNHRLDLLAQLHDANPRFKITVFAIPGLCTRRFLNTLPAWVEIAAHGWMHPHPREAENWTYDRAMEALTEPIVEEFFVNGWKSPGWQVSDGTYQALMDEGWWIADHPDNNSRRPAGLKTHVLGTGDHIHSHVSNSCGNGLEELWDYYLSEVTDADGFEFVSQAVTPWEP